LARYGKRETLGARKWPGPSLSRKGVWGRRKGLSFCHASYVLVTLEIVVILVEGRSRGNPRRTGKTQKIPVSQKNASKIRAITARGTRPFPESTTGGESGGG